MQAADADNPAASGAAKADTAEQDLQNIIPSAGEAAAAPLAAVMVPPAIAPMGSSPANVATTPLAVAAADEVGSMSAAVAVAASPSASSQPHAALAAGTAPSAAAGLPANDAPATPEADRARALATAASTDPAISTGNARPIAVTATAVAAASEPQAAPAIAAAATISKPLTTASSTDKGQRDVTADIEPHTTTEAKPATPAKSTGTADSVGKQGPAPTTDAAPANDAAISPPASPAPRESAPQVAGLASAVDQPISGAQPPPPQPIQSAALPVTAQPHVALASGAPVPLQALAVEIAALAQSGATRFEIRLDPAELGRIDVRIDIDRHGQVTSHLRVEKPETLTLLRQDSPQLQRALDDAGLKSGDGGLQFSLRDQSSSGQNNGGDNPRAHAARRLIVSDQEVVPAPVVGRSYGRMLGSAAGVDIRV